MLNPACHPGSMSADANEGWVWKRDSKLSLGFTGLKPHYLWFSAKGCHTRFLKACLPLNRSRCQGWSPLSLASTHKPQTSNVAYISSINPWNTGLLAMSKRVLSEDNPLDAHLGNKTLEWVGDRSPVFTIFLRSKTTLLQDIDKGA